MATHRHDQANPAIYNFSGVSLEKLNSATKRVSDNKRN